MWVEKCITMEVELLVAMRMEHAFVSTLPLSRLVIPPEKLSARITRYWANGSPSGENKLDQAIAWGMKNHGLVPGQNLRYIQFAGGKTYFYAGGNSSGNAGSDCYRMDPR